jgi:hypothetical protein
MAADFAGHRQQQVTTASASTAQGQTVFASLSTSVFAAPPASMSAASIGTVLSPISVGLPTGSGAMTSMIRANLGQSPNTTSSSPSPLRMSARDGRISNTTRTPGGALTRNRPQPVDGISPVEAVHRTGEPFSVVGQRVTTGRLALSPFAIDAALAELDTLPTSLLERPADMPSLEAEPAAPQGLDVPPTEDEQGDRASNYEKAEAVIAAAAAFFMTERAVRRSRRGKDRTQARRLGIAQWESGLTD